MHERPDQIEQLYFQRPGIEFRRRTGGVPPVQELQQQKQSLLRRRNRREPVDDAAGRDLDGILDPNAEDVAQQFQHGLEGRSPAVGQHASFVDTNAFSPAIFGKFKAKAALSDAGLSDNANHSTIALYGICEFEFEGGELATSSDEGS